jgi:hypothetical protein
VHVADAGRLQPPLLKRRRLAPDAIGRHDAARTPRR